MSDVTSQKQSRLLAQPGERRSSEHMIGTTQFHIEFERHICLVLHRSTWLSELGGLNAYCQDIHLHIAQIYEGELVDRFFCLIRGVLDYRVQDPG